MNLCRCEKGHFYDKEKYVSCPHCSGGSASDESLTNAFTEDITSAVTQPNMHQVQVPETEAYYSTNDLPISDKLADDITEDIYSANMDSPTIPLAIPSSIPEPELGQDDDHTIGIYDDFFMPQDAKNIQERGDTVSKPMVNKVSTPCVGWLVALSGEHIGTDFRLKTGKNFIGRDIRMDVALKEDKSVSRDRHAIVVYEPKAHLYLVQPGESSSLVYRNDEVVLTPVKLEAYDIITVGDVDLLFMPLCGSRFNWGELFEKMKNK